MPIGHLQHVAKAEMGKRAMGIELRNNGGEFDRIIVTMLLEQRSDERCDRYIVERMKLCGAIEPRGLCLCGAVLSGCGSMSQKSQES